MKNFHLIILLAVLFSCKSGSKANENTDKQWQLNSNPLIEQIEQHNKAIHPMDDWMRDPFITIGPDNMYYLTCTQQKNETNSRGIPVWKSHNLIDWEFVGFPYTLNDAQNISSYEEINKEKNIEQGKGQPLRLWAPEMHFIDGRWVFVHTSNAGLGNLVLTKTDDLMSGTTDWGSKFGRQHDPFIFSDDDGSRYLVAKCTEIIKLKDDLSGFDGKPIKISPSNRKMGHEGAFIIKFEGKYVLFGTAWSTDEMRHGTYNLYYAVADNIEGPYGERKFAGRFLGHGTLFKDKKGRWWCTAFYNANEPAIDPTKAIEMDLSETAYTINNQGLTLVPMEFKMENDEIVVFSKDESYRYPGSEEVQKFD